MMTILVIAVFLFLGEYVRADPDPTSPIITIGLANITVSQGQRAQVPTTSQTQFSYSHSPFRNDHCSDVEPLPFPINYLVT